MRTSQKKAAPTPWEATGPHVSRGDTMKKIADERRPVCRDGLGGATLVGAWLDEHPCVALAVLMVAMLAVSTADSWF